MVTAAFEETPDLGKDCYAVGLAFCSPKDQFSRKKGRLIAEGRMAKDPWVLEPGEGGLDPNKTVAQQIFEAIEQEARTDVMRMMPQWVSKEPPETLTRRMG